MERKGWLVVGAFFVFTVVIFVLGLRTSCGVRGAGFADAIIPANSDMLFRMDVGPMRRLFMEPWLGKSFEEWPKGGMWGEPAVEQEVKALLLDRIGFHVHEVRRVTVFANVEDRAVAAIFDAELEGAPTGDGRDYEGTTIYKIGDVRYAMVDGKLVLGTRNGVRRVIDVYKGTAESIAKSDGLTAKRHAELLDAVGAAPVIFTADLSKLPPDEYAIATGGEVLEGAAVSVDSSGGWHVLVQGDPAALDSLKKKLEDLMASGMGLLEAQKESLKKDGDTAEALMAILSNQAVKDLRTKLVLERKGRHLELRFEMEGATAAIPILGVLAAVAIPSFMKYMERAKRAEYEMRDERMDQDRMIRELREDDDDVDRAFPGDSNRPTAP